MRLNKILNKFKYVIDTPDILYVIDTPDMLYVIDTPDMLYVIETPDMLCKSNANKKLFRQQQ